jgi:hypothetical protein
MKLVCLYQCLVEYVNANASCCERMLSDLVVVTDRTRIFQQQTTVYLSYVLAGVAATIFAEKILRLDSSIYWSLKLTFQKVAFHGMHI